MERHQEWLGDFVRSYERLSHGAVPHLVLGTEPHQDLASLRDRDAGIYWFVYPTERYDSDYWGVITLIYGSLEEYSVAISHTLPLTESVMGLAGIEHYDIPDAWILAAELQRP